MIPDKFKRKVKETVVATKKGKKKPKGFVKGVKRFGKHKNSAYPDLHRRCDNLTKELKILDAKYEKLLHLLKDKAESV